jgi:SAM-dependent methyltransferase
LTNQERFAQLTEWYQTDIGHSLYQFEFSQLANLLPVCYGYQLLQIGGPADLSWLNPSPIKHKIWLAPHAIKPSNTSSFKAAPDFLPFQSNSFDVILLPHTLECFEHPEMILREAYEVLTPGGYLVILGLNRFSLWGARHKWQKWANHTATLPWLWQFQRLSRMQMQLIHMNCVIDSSEIGYFLPMCETKERLHSWRLLDILGSFTWPALGASYTILARKQIEAMTLLPLERSRLVTESVKVGLAPQSRTSHEQNH